MVTVSIRLQRAHPHKGSMFPVFISTLMNMKRPWSKMYQLKRCISTLLCPGMITFKLIASKKMLFNKAILAGWVATKVNMRNPVSLR